MELFEPGIDNLRCAIVQLTAEDYLRARTNLHTIDVHKSTGDREKYRILYEECVNFFRSDWYGILCRISPDYLIEQLDKEFEEWRTEYDIKKKETKRGKNIRRQFADVRTRKEQSI